MRFANLVDAIPVDTRPVTLPGADNWMQGRNPQVAQKWRPEPESNRRKRICSPVRNHSAIGPCADPVEGPEGAPLANGRGGRNHKSWRHWLAVTIHKD